MSVYSCSKGTKNPKWLNLGLGYGAEGMICGKSEKELLFLTKNPERFRQFHLSFDVDLTKINTESHFLKTIFSIFSTVKIPTSTIQYSVDKGFKGYLLYFQKRLTA